MDDNKSIIDSIPQMNLSITYDTTIAKVNGHHRNNTYSCSFKNGMHHGLYVSKD